MSVFPSLLLMHLPRVFRAGLLAACLLLSPALLLADTPFVTTNIVVGTYIYDLPSPPPVTVLPNSRVVFTLAYDSSVVRSVQWFYNGKALTATGTSLTLSNVTSANAGVYTVQVKTTYDNYTATMAEITLRVEAPPRLRLLNLSTRVTINAAQPSVINGLVVSASQPGLSETKTLLIRAAGPTLANYGVKDALSDPEFHLYDSTGTEIFFVSVAVVPSPADTAAAQVGAFPLLSASEPRILAGLKPGVYSIKVNSAHGNTGTALLEIYEVPDPVVGGG